MRWLPFIVLTGCATGGTPAMSSSQGDAPVDTSSSGDSTGRGSSCTLGTTADCGSCGSACPTYSSMETLATCSDATTTATCGITCVGEYYDMDSSSANGCEAQDLPVQDTAATAVAINLPNSTGGSAACDGATNPCTVVGFVFSDDRVHDTAPTSRPLGRPDWYALTAVGKGTNHGVTACLGISNYPVDNMYQVCISDAGGMTPSNCANALGGSATSACVTPSGGETSGSFYVSVSRLAGTRTILGYALYLAH